MDINITIKKDVLSRISKFLNHSSYKEFIESSSSFNQKLVKDRKFRLPFLDSQTGVAQSDCCLWMTKNDRIPQGDLPDGKIYTYPAKRWVKRKRQYLLDDVYLRTRSSSSSHLGPSTSAVQDQSMLVDHSSNDTSSSAAHIRMTDTSAGHNSNSNSFINHNNDSSFMHDSSSNSEATAHGDFDDSNDPHHPQQNHLNHHQQQSTQHQNPNQNQSSNQQQQHHHHQPQQQQQQQQQQPQQQQQQPQHQQQQQQPQQQQPSQQHHGSPASSAPKTKRERKYKIEKTNDPLKPYKCEWCEMSYKTRPGLTYHRNHCHAQNIVCNSSGDDTINYDDPSNSFGNNNHTGNQSSNTNDTPSNANKQIQQSSSTSSISTFNHLSSSIKSNDNTDTNHSTNNKNGTSRPSNSDNNNDNSPYCDFCLGDAKENKKTQKPEELVSCSDCGRSGHPTCLNFTPNIILSVKKYKWQCIECKSCGLCGTSDNDDQLLFCDDCDRGYHMYCLNPPLAKPPDGSWSCSLCIEEYHRKV